MVPISPQVYSAEAVVFDTKPLFDYAQRLDERRAKRALAEQEAFDEWNKANEKAFDSSNLRTQERPLFDKGLEEYRQLSIEAKRNPKDYSKRAIAQKKADELFSLVNKSKNAKEIGKEYTAILRNIQSNPEQRKTTDLDALIKDISQNDLPIGFPGASFLGIPKRPDDTSPKMNYYKPAPVDTYDIIQKNLGGIGMGELQKISETDKNFQYKVVPKYTPEAIRTVAERVAKSVTADPLLQSSYKVKGQQYDSKDLAKLNLLVKSVKDAKGNQVFADIEVDIDDPVSIAFGEAVEDMLNRRGEVKTETDRVGLERFKSSLIAGRSKEKVIGVGEGNALDEITNIVGTKKGVVVKDGVANLNGVPYSGKLVMLGNEIPESVRSPLKSIGYKFQDTEQIDVNMVDGKIESIQALGRTSPKQPARRKSVISRSMMENAQLKFSTEPQKGPQMQFGQGLAPQTPAFTFPGGKAIKF